MSFKCRHGLCNAHHLRELIFIEEQHQQEWAKQMAELLLRIKMAVCKAQKAGGVALAPELLQKFSVRYQQIISDAYVENPWEEPTGPPRRGREKKTKPLNLIERQAHNASRFSCL